MKEPVSEPSRGGSDWRAAVPVGTETVQTGSLIPLTTIESPLSSS